jgi:hypothetical protein
MTTVLWLTDDLALQSDVERATSFANAELHICTTLEKLPRSPVDIILWSPDAYDEATYLALTEHCDQVLELIERGRHQLRLCPIKSKGAPRYYIVVPFDPEEAGTIIRGVVERAKIRKRDGKPHSAK